MLFSAYLASSTLHNQKFSACSIVERYGEHSLLSTLIKACLDPFLHITNTSQEWIVSPTVCSTLSVNQQISLRMRKWKIMVGVN